MKKPAKIVPGINGELIDSKLAKTGSVRISVKKSSGHIVNPLCHYSFGPDKCKELHAKAQANVGKQISTTVSQTTNIWKGDEYFYDFEVK